MSDRPKTAFEAAMERLKASDPSDEEPRASLTDEQKQEIAEARRKASAHLAEREILYRSALARTAEPEARGQLDEEYVIDRQRIEGDRDREIERIRKR